MMSSTMPSAKYSCSGSELRLEKGRTAIEGLSGSGRAGFGSCSKLPVTVAPAGPCASRTCPTKRKPLRGKVLMRRCSSPESPIALRATFRRVVSAASDTLPPVPDGFNKIIFADHALPVPDQVVEQVEYLWRDGDDVRSAMQLAPVSVDCVVLENVAQVAIFLR